MQAARPASPPLPTAGEPKMELRDSPRTREALRRTGITWEEVQIRDPGSFRVYGADLPEAQRMRFQHYEVRRQEKLDIVIRERKKIVAAVRPGMSSDGADPQAARNLAAIETLLDDELRRLEKNLRSQVRVHAAVEQGNTAQLLREEKLQQKLDYRKERIRVASATAAQKGGTCARSATRKWRTARSCRRRWMPSTPRGRR